jgi:hypothetical protein
MVVPPLLLKKMIIPLVLQARDPPCPADWIPPGMSPAFFKPGRPGNIFFETIR